MKNILAEKKKAYIVVSAKGNNINRLLTRANLSKIDIYQIDYIDNESVTLWIKKQDYKKLRRQNLSYKFNVISNVGIYKIKDVMKKHHFILIGMILGLGLLFLLSHVIVKIEVVHSNKEIRMLVENELDNQGIKRLTLKKNYETLEKIKENILNKYPDRLEWLEINTIGMNYRVSVEERIITEIEKEKDACHVVAKKDAVVTRIVNTKGMNFVEPNKYVRSGDILISGNIMDVEAIKGVVCASGVVYGEVWYEVSVVVPLNFNEEVITGKMRYNFAYETLKSKNKIFRSRLENFLDTNEKTFDILGMKLYLQKEEEIVLVPKTYTEEEAINRAMELAKEKIMVGMSRDEKILSQKVLKKTLNDSKMIVEVFVSVEETISDVIEFTNEELGSDDKEHND